MQLEIISNAPLKLEIISNAPLKLEILKMTFQTLLKFCLCKI